MNHLLMGFVDRHFFYLCLYDILYIRVLNKRQISIDNCSCVNMNEIKNLSHAL